MIRALTKCWHYLGCSPTAWWQFLSLNLFRSRAGLFAMARSPLVPAKGCRIRFGRGSSLELVGGVILGEKPIFRRSKVETRLFVARDATLEVRSFSRIWCGGDIRVFEGATLVLDGATLNEGVEISCRRRVTLGPGTMVGRSVGIRDSDGHDLAGEREAVAEVSIGGHVWIGTRALILKGVTIGDGAVVAAGAVVTHDIPPGCMAAGVPARVIRTGVTWDGVFLSFPPTVDYDARRLSDPQNGLDDV